MAAEYRRYYGALKTDDARLSFLLMLRERRNKHGDTECGELLLELGQKWLTDRG